MRRVAWIPLFLLACVLLHGTCLAAQTTLDLWPGVAPGSEHWRQHEVVTRGTPLGTVVTNVVTPTLTVYLPDPAQASGAGVIVAPGGYCIALAIDREGNEVARWLQQRGIAAFVLKYRTQEKREPGIPKNLDMDRACRYGIADAVQAIKLVRRHAKAWGVAPGRVGIVGFSAGGMVASGALLQTDAATRPDFAALIYGAPFGAMPAIPAKLPPVFMAWAQDDPIARDAVATFHEVLLKAGTRPEAHIFSAGGHGFGMHIQGTSSDHWIEEFHDWLQAQGFLQRARPPAATPHDHTMPD
ncbi:Dienelactone hydrolase domain-containing protein OS=Rhodanobacter lindaniclasticus OX=75310 GN=B1991_00885 PE=4 SV=1 [Rhodanobacter lindaniclasticus]